ncbi:MAG: DUF2156 domain-containing protein [Clostridiales bacterium]|nr:DUF2156 domain-containing protein [Clostridiales bacterium]
MRLNFRDVTLEDKQWIEPLLKLGARASLEYNFTTTFVWRFSFKHQIARMDDYFLLRVDAKAPVYLFPAGQGPLMPVIRALAADAEQLGVPFVLSGVSAGAKTELETLFPGKFTFEIDRDNADYMYETQALAALRGKKLSGKRNHINRFMENHRDWRYETLSRDNFDDVRRMNTLWCMQNGCAEDLAISEEYCAVESAIRHYGELGLSGGLIRTGGRVVAFSIGDPLNDDTFLVHFEKAFPDVQGAYQMINQQFVQHTCMAYRYVDREEDAGVPGLRRAKLSYYPVMLAEKYLSTLKEPL